MNQDEARAKARYWSKLCADASKHNPGLSRAVHVALQNAARLLESSPSNFGVSMSSKIERGKRLVKSPWADVEAELSALLTEGRDSAEVTTKMGVIRRAISHIGFLQARLTESLARQLDAEHGT